MDRETLEEQLENQVVEASDGDTAAHKSVARTYTVSRSKQQPILYGAIGLLLLAGVALLILGLTGNSAGGVRTSPVAIPSIEALQTPSSLADPKLASVLGDLQLIYVREGEAKARQFAEQNGLLVGDNVYLTLDLDTTDTAAQDELVKQLQALGVKIDNRYSKTLDISFTLEQLGRELAIPTAGVGTPIALPTSIGPDSLPPSLLQKLSDLKHVARVRLPRDTSPRGVLFDGPEGVKVVRADEWQRQGFTGRGLKIGILDIGGFMGYEALLGKELPENVVVKAFNRSGNVEGNPGVDENDRVHGTACAEIVHAMVPDAELYFAAFDSDEEPAIKWLISQGVTIISASYGGHYYPSDGKRYPAISLINSTHDQGIFWALSAGNEGSDHYKGRFKQGEDGLNIFYNNSNVLGFKAFSSGPIQITMRWDDWDNSTVDYNLYLLDAQFKRIAKSEDVQNGAFTEPVEFMRFNLPSDGQYYIAIGGKAGVRAVDYDIFIRGSIELEKSIASGSIGSPGDAAGALTVGAVTWNETTIAEYSSQGPTDDGRVKPEISAPAGVTSRSYGRLGRVFDGTSASTPFVAGAAALVWSANPNMKPDEIRDFLLNRAKDLGTPGVDNTYGYGLLDMGAGPNAAPTEPPTAVPPTQQGVPTTGPPTAQPPTRAPSVPTPGRQPTAAPVLPGSTSSSGGNSGVMWMAIVGGSMVGVSLLMGLLLFGLSRRGRSSRPPGGYSGPPQGGPYYPQQPPPGLYPGPSAPIQPGNRPPTQPPYPQQQPPQYRHPQQPPPYGQASPNYQTPGPGPGPGPGPMQPLAQGYPPQYPPQPQQPQQGYGPQGQPIHPGQGYTTPGQGQPQPPPTAYPPQPGYGGQAGYPPPTQPQQPQPQPQQPASPPVLPPVQATGPGGRSLPPPPKGMAPCPNCARALPPNASQCANCGWRKP